MVEYNTALPKLEMREYGRNIQKLITHCVEIEDMEQRTNCAHAIFDIMKQLFPELKDDSIVWNHIYLISKGKLNIEYPCEIQIKDLEKSDSGTLPYSVKNEKYRVYGSNLVKMIKEISKMEGGLDKDQLIFLIANQMKKLLIATNPDGVTDARVFKDIKDITSGAIDITSDTYRLNEYIGVTNNQEVKKKKKK